MVVSRSNGSSVFYFAYGSNLLKSRIEERIKDVRLVARASLDGYAFRLNKVSNRDGSAKANIEKEANSHVWGFVYQLSEDQLGELDKFEACPVHYQRQVVTVNIRGRFVQAHTYVATAKYVVHYPIVPTPEYLDLILEGAIDTHLPNGYTAHIMDVAKNQSQKLETACKVLICFVLTLKLASK